MRHGHSTPGQAGRRASRGAAVRPGRAGQPWCGRACVKSRPCTSSSLDTRSQPILRSARNSVPMRLALQPAMHTRPAGGGGRGAARGRQARWATLHARSHCGAQRQHLRCPARPPPRPLPPHPAAGCQTVCRRRRRTGHSRRTCRRRSARRPSWQTALRRSGPMRRRRRARSLPLAGRRCGPAVQRVAEWRQRTQAWAPGVGARNAARCRAPGRRHAAGMPLPARARLVQQALEADVDEAAHPADDECGPGGDDGAAAGDRHQPGQDAVEQRRNVARPAQHHLHQQRHEAARPRRQRRVHRDLGGQLQGVCQKGRGGRGVPACVCRGARVPPCMAAWLPTAARALTPMQP